MNDPQQAELLALASAGDPHSQFLVADIHHNTAQQDMETAVYWYLKAANQGHPAAIYNLSQIYGDLRSPHRDPEKGLAWITRAAQIGLAVSQNALGEIYEEGLEVRKDHAQALRMFHLAAAQSYPTAHFNIGLSMERHESRPDYHKAFRHYQKAANLGHAKAITNLSVLYLKGRGVPVDQQKAVETLCLAIHMGDFVANRTLGLICLYYSTPPDLITGLHHLMVAETAGVEIPPFLAQQMTEIKAEMPSKVIDDMRHRTQQFYKTKKDLHLKFIHNTQITFVNNAVKIWLAGTQDTERPSQ